MIKEIIAFSLIALLGWPTNAQNRDAVKQLKNWHFYGQGTELLEGHGQYLLKENPDGSKGVGLISPTSYSNNVVMRYKVMALTPATVLVAILSASDRGSNTQLTLPEKYDGSINFWSGGCDNYFFAFHNAAHNYPPFVRRFDDKKIMLDVAKKNLMQAGQYYDVEVGRKENKIWMKIDGQTILKYNDPKPYSGGHLGLRIRGTAGEYAACLIKDIEIITK